MSALGYESQMTLYTMEQYFHEVWESIEDKIKKAQNEVIEEDDETQVSMMSQPHLSWVHESKDLFLKGVLVQSYHALEDFLFLVSMLCRTKLNEPVPKKKRKNNLQRHLDYLKRVEGTIDKKINYDYYHEWSCMILKYASVRNCVVHDNSIIQKEDTEPRTKKLRNVVQSDERLDLVDFELKPYVEGEDQVKSERLVIKDRSFIKEQLKEFDLMIGMIVELLQLNHPSDSWKITP